ncbi:UNVERIFIED_CONTAM: Copia protein [Sesamum radiatum]|uniref:Copia protein n=1 Tax=Sesamum radiatum TaxID=300843 RepID=A0AAW2MF51_SESRA
MARQNILKISLDENGIGYLPQDYFYVNHKIGTWRILLVDPMPTTISPNNVPVLRKSARVPQPPERDGFLGMTGQLDNDPKTYGEAMSDIDSGKWPETMKSEIDSISSNQVWTLVDRPKGVKPIRCKWVYKCKIGANVEVTTFKARLVAKGYTQRAGVDFEETFSPIAMTKSIRIMLGIAACYDYEIWWMDVKNGFPTVPLRKRLYGSTGGIHGSRRRAKGLPSPKIHLWF